MLKVKDLYHANGVAIEVEGYGKFNEVFAFDSFSIENFLNWQSAFEANHGKVTGKQMRELNLKSYMVDVIEGKAFVRALM